MTIGLHEVLAAFQGGLRLNLKILREVYGAGSLELMPQPGQPLYLKDDKGEPLSLFAPLDGVLGPAVILSKTWDPAKQNMLKQILGRSEEDLCLIDIGANAGFFSRQCLSQIGQIKQVYCYEPHPQNFRLLSRNLIGVGRAVLNNFGLSDRGGDLSFYVDPDNTGNYSLNPNAMPTAHSSIKVQIIDGNVEAGRWLRECDLSFVYKSDTQGFDEVIATSFDLAFWDRVRVGIFELWRLAGKSYDTAKFRAILDSFPQKIFEKQPAKYVDTDEVIDYLRGEDKVFDDLYFWR